MCIKHLQKGNLTYEYNMPFFVNVFGLIFVFLYPTMGCFLMYFPEFCLVNLVGADANLDSPAKKKHYPRSTAVQLACWQRNLLFWFAWYLKRCIYIYTCSNMQLIHDVIHADSLATEAEILGAYRSKISQGDNHSCQWQT